MCQYINDFIRSRTYGAPCIIIPIPKTTGSVIPLWNLRQISLTCVTAKMFENIIKARLNQISERDNWLPEYQNGFRKGRSTSDCTIIVQQAIHTAFRKKEILLAVFLDIQKAYDNVNRTLLFEIIKEKPGIPIKVLNWLKKFLLSDRRGRVKFKNVLSKEYIFKNGVPQGSPISPLLFNIYASGLKEVRKENVSQFADDLVIWETASDYELARSKIQKSINEINEWVHSIGLRFAPKKCKPVAFTRKHIWETQPIVLDGEEIKVENSAKYLGITFDKTMCWKQHIEVIVGRAKQRSYYLRMLANSKNGVLQSTMVLLYQSIVRPIIGYGSCVWGEISDTNKRKLDSVQHQALTKALGVMRIAKRTRTNYEASTWSLDLRRKQQLIRTWRRVGNTQTMGILLSLSHQEILNGKRQSFIERVRNLAVRLKIPLEVLKNLKNDEIDFIIKKIQIKEASKEEVIFFSLKCPKRSQSDFGTSRKINSIWHQARLRVIPLNDLMERIKISKKRECTNCKVPETIEHFVKECPIYENIWEHNNVSQERVKPLENILSNFPKWKKRKIAQVLFESAKRRRIS